MRAEVAKNVDVAVAQSYIPWQNQTCKLHMQILVYCQEILHDEVIRGTFLMACNIYLYGASHAMGLLYWIKALYYSEVSTSLVIMSVKDIMTQET